VNEGTARMGSVAAALKRVVMSEYDNGVANATPLSNYNTFAQGIGWRAIEEKLKNIPGITQRTIQDTVACPPGSRPASPAVRQSCNCHGDRPGRICPSAS